jgi:hypothetical protein
MINRLLPYQVPHADRIADALVRLRVALDSSDMGTGKTYAACATAAQLGLPLAVVAPKAVLPSWKKVAALFSVHVIGIHNYEAVKLGKTGLGRFVAGEFQWTLPPDTLLVFDEVQRCKARDSQNAKLLIAAKRQGIRILMCSATAASDPLEMRAVGFALGLHKLHNFWPWARAHGVVKGRFGMEFDGGPEDIARIHQCIFTDLRVGSRMRIADIPDFPPTQIIAEPVDTGKEREIQAVYDQLKIDLNHAVATNDLERKSEIADEINATAANHLTIQLRARQDIEHLKLDTLAAMSTDAVAEGMSVAIFVNFDESIDALAKSLGTDCIIRGGQSDGERQNAITRFQANEEPIIICNIRAGGVGVSLHDPTGVKPRLALISPTFSAQDLRQALGRVHRAGGAHSIQRIIFAAGTVEERACTAVEAKLACIDLLNDGDLKGQIVMAASHGNGMSTDSSEQRPHAEHSPSALHYKEICPGFKNRGESGPAAEEGTRLHAALETGKTDGFTDEQLQCIAMCRDYIEALERQARARGSATVHREVQLDIADGATFGTADFVLVGSGGAGELVDFKFGRNSVPDAEINAQMQAYALGLFEKFPELQTVKVHILLPRRDEVSTAVYHRADMPRLRLRITTIIARCKAPEPEIRSTENCLWCARQATCSALHQHALVIANGYDEELKLPEQYHPGQITDPAVMSRALTVARVLEKWCESVKHHALQMRLGGQEIPGHELRTRAGTRKITDPLATWAAVRERVTPEQFIGCCDISLPKLETIFAEAAPRGAKAKAKQELCEALADLGVVETAKETFYLAKTRK